MNIAKDLLDAMKSKRKTTGYDTTATVTRIEGNTAWVHIPGGVDETPVNLTINASVGETVQVRVADGTAFLVGNASAPPTNDAVASAAMRVATQTAATVEEVTEIKNGSESLKAAKLKGFINGAFAQLKTQYDQAERQDHIAILFENLDEDSDTFGALAIGTQGLLISQERENDEWVWTTALTASGLIADIIVAGTITDALGNNYWDLDTGEMKVGANILIEGSGGSSQTFSSIISDINGDISSVETIANGKIKTYYCAQNQLPATTNLTVGDLWVNTENNNELKRWNGSSWENARDGTIATAQTKADDAYTLANGKNKVYYLSSQPSGSDYVTGDIWFDTSNGYKMSRWTGSAWSESLFSSAAFSEIAAGKIVAGTITAAITATDLTMAGGTIDMTTSASNHNMIKLRGTGGYYFQIGNCGWEIVNSSGTVVAYGYLGSGNQASISVGEVGTNQNIYIEGRNGCITVGKNKFYSAGNCGLDMNNSDIINFNGLYAADEATSPEEGINWLNGLGDGWYDSLWANGGVLYFCPENMGSGTYKKTVWHSGNFTPSDKLDKSGYSNTEAKVFISNANGTLAVSNLPYSYISGLTSSAQTQLNGKVTGSAAFDNHDSATVAVASGSNVAIDNFTVPAGYWTIDVVVRYNANATGYRACWLSESSTGDAIAVAATNYVAAVNGMQTFCHITYCVKLTASKKYYLVGKQNSGSSINAISRARWIGIET